MPDSFYLTAWLFVLYAFLGWCIEVVYAAVTLGHFINRGFLNGPVCPIYGFGMLLVISCFFPIKEKFILLFIGSVLMTSVLEWITGFILEKFFHTKWWDYSDRPFNLNGYICLAFSLLWGLACTFVLYVVHPSLLQIVQWFPRPLGWAFLCSALAGLASDTVLTVLALFKLQKHFRLADELEASIRSFSDTFGENLAGQAVMLKQVSKTGAEELRENIEEVKESLAVKADDLREDIAVMKESLAFKADDLREDIAVMKESLAFKADDLREDIDAMKESLSIKAEGLWDDIEEIKESLSENLYQDLRARYDSLRAQRLPGFRRLSRAYPQLRLTDKKELFDSLRDHPILRPDAKTPKSPHEKDGSHRS